MNLGDFIPPAVYNGSGNEQLRFSSVNPRKPYPNVINTIDEDGLQNHTIEGIETIRYYERLRKAARGQQAVYNKHAREVTNPDLNRAYRNEML